MRADERELVPLEDERASTDFMAQLREYSATFRISAHAQAVSVHLGAKAEAAVSVE